MNHLQKINLSQLQTCDQRWENMTPNDQGRLCKKCDKTIIDFTQKSDREIAEIHTFSTEPICGMYLPQQYQIKPKPYRRKSRFNLILLSFLGLTASPLAIYSQTQELLSKKEIVAIEIKDITNNREEQFYINTPYRDSMIISGIITDEEDNNIPYATIHIKGTLIAANTDKNGFYSLDLSHSFDTLSQITLVYTYVGFPKQERDINRNQFDNDEGPINGNIKITNEYQFPYEGIVFRIPLDNNYSNPEFINLPTKNITLPQSSLRIPKK